MEIKQLKPIETAKFYHVSPSDNAFLTVRKLGKKPPLLKTCIFYMSNILL